MELAIEQALQQGVAAHKEGNLQDAERLYRAILQSQPLHPDANHNLGVLAVSVNKADAALLLFKTALEANPKIEQFWLSYIDALIKEQQFDNAKKVLEQAKKHGVPGEKLNTIELQLDFNNKTSNSSNLHQKQLNSLLKNYQTGRYDDAEKLALSITEQFPEHQFAWKILGALLGQTGRISEAVDTNQKVVKLAPQDAEARNNLGNTLKELGRLDEAEASYTQAIALRSNFSDAHSNLGVTLQELGRLEEAEASHREAIALEPQDAVIHYNLGVTLKELGRLEESEASYKKAIALKPVFSKAYGNLGVTLQELGRLDEACLAYVQAINLKPDYIKANSNFSLAIKTLRFNSYEPQFYSIFTNILTTGNFTRPNEVAHSIISLLKHDPLIKTLLADKNIIMSHKKIVDTIQNLDKITLLHHLMRVCPLPDLQLERLFVAMRKFVLENLLMIEISCELLYFLSTLSLHCFTNEYVYFESDEEMQLVNKLQAKITQRIAQSKQPEVIDILCFASYRPLHQYDWCQNLEMLDHLSVIKTRLIEEPLTEKVIAQEILVVGEILDAVSFKVKQQYEENPYPRWVKLAIPIKAKSIAAVCDDLKLHLYSENIKAVTAPELLIAGCGTGQHSIGTASRFSCCQVTAVDLSLASLAYAQRKTNELGVGNLEYLQADILALNQLGRKFDIIESTGVLHHMNEPMVGWKVLTELLKPGGLMKIGLYSELGRRHIVKIREEIALLKIGTSEAEIRAFRASLSESRNDEHQRLIASNDFFSLSTLRDLIFHVQEHNFTILQIEDCLNELGLKFCGFEDENINLKFKEFHSKESNICDLALWHQYEKSNSDSFSGMYQFWCQKL
jgi:tetratricopeptide (TPR) repeat protein/SAM-dependent methyltransferase